MPLVLVVSPDSSLCRALQEQVESGAPWDDSGVRLVACSGYDEAVASSLLSESSLVVFDDAAIRGEPSSLLLSDQRLASSSVFVLGDAAPDFPQGMVCEAFSKPVRLGSLLTRMHFHFQAQTYNADVSLVLGCWRFLPRKKQLIHFDGRDAISLSDKESHLLDYIYRASKPVSRQELLAAVWGYDGGVDTHTLETHIYRLRRKLAAADGNARLGDVFLVESSGYWINPLWRDA